MVVDGVFCWSLQMMAPSLASRRHLCEFHREDYVAFLQFPDQSDAARLKEYGLLEDCEIFEHLWEYCRAVAGASIQGAQLLCHGSADTVINFGGGRHHAKHVRIFGKHVVVVAICASVYHSRKRACFVSIGQAEAAGYCYVNDAVLAIHQLLRHFERVMYIDIDIHHSDGVRVAGLVAAVPDDGFESSCRVLWVRRFSKLSTTRSESCMFHTTSSAQDSIQGRVA